MINIMEIKHTLVVVIVPLFYDSVLTAAVFISDYDVGRCEMIIEDRLKFSPP